MLCESWRETLGVAAISGEALPGEAQAHLAACASCRAALTDEQQIFALMDGGLRSIANVETPLSLLPKVRAQIAEPPAKTRWVPALTFATTAIVLIAIIAFSLSRGSRTKEQYPTASAVAPQTSVPPAKPPSVQREPAAKPVKKRTAPPSTAVSQPSRDIIVSADEQTSLQIYLSAFHARTRNSVALVTVKGEPAAEIKPLEISEIEMPRLTIEQLQAGESK